MVDYEIPLIATLVFVIIMFILFFFIFFREKIKIICCKHLAVCGGADLEVQEPESPHHSYTYIESVNIPVHDAKITAKRKNSDKRKCSIPAPQENIKNRRARLDYSKRSLSNPSIWQSTRNRNKQSDKKHYLFRRTKSSTSLNKKKPFPLSKNHISPPIPVSIPNQKNGTVSRQASKGDRGGDGATTHRELQSNMYENHTPKPTQQVLAGCQATSRDEALPGEYFKTEAGEATPDDVTGESPERDPNIPENFYFVLCSDGVYSHLSTRNQRTILHNMYNCVSLSDNAERPRVT
ncbi:uncharacterized protein LOC131936297 [Physella acuta]|uniref:uncharacterized protein LOC131936297 n=1 Tax=Physella acuta TaxID=109671 RepID=UPI0027DAE93B|nr:uncharacterized protein LOC131936297 [Physella acuta]XP_059149199.1 uncharacterized protein LOC131936297 [Physella acuta]XP_059149200.1 uncharacterized protein LOC131936297 [Physella acuta]